MKINILILILTSLLINSCFHNKIICTCGSGNVIKKEVQVSNFKNIILKSNADIYLSQGTENKVILETDDNLFDLIKFANINDNLTIYSESRICPKKLNLYITMKEVKGLKISGSGDILSENLIKSDDLDLQISGSGDMIIKSFESMKINISIQGSGDIKIAGKSEKCNVSINGSGDVYAAKTSVDYSNIEINGSGDVRLNVAKELKVDISGSGDVFYQGKPEKVNINVTGSGDVKELKSE